MLPERVPDGNLYVVAAPRGRDELSEPLVGGAGGGGILLERIVSTGQATPRGAWLEQERDEWVALLDGVAELAFEDGSHLRLVPGDHVLIRAGERHRVEWTRPDPPCVWLAVHAANLERAS